MPAFNRHCFLCIGSVKLLKKTCALVRRLSGASVTEMAPLTEKVLIVKIVEHGGQETMLSDSRKGAELQHFIVPEFKDFENLQDDSDFSYDQKP